MWTGFTALRDKESHLLAVGYVEFKASAERGLETAGKKPPHYHYYIIIYLIMKISTNKIVVLHIFGKKKLKMSEVSV